MPVRWYSQAGQASAGAASRVAPTQRRASDRGLFREQWLVQAREVSASELPGAEPDWLNGPAGAGHFGRSAANGSTDA
jgi:hypothetical protein